MVVRCLVFRTSCLARPHILKISETEYLVRFIQAMFWSLALVPINHGSRNSGMLSYVVFADCAVEADVPSADAPMW